MTELSDSIAKGRTVELARTLEARLWDGDDICPPWWPRRPWPWPPRRGNDPRTDVLAVDRLYRALTLLASSFQWVDDGMLKDVRTVAIAHVREAAQSLGGGASHAWEPGDDICPPWPWWRHPHISGPWGDPDPSPWRDRSGSNPMPGRAAGLGDTLALLQAYNVAAKIGDAGTRLAATSALGKAIATQAELLGKTLG